MSLSELPAAPAALAFTDVSVVRGGRLLWSRASFTVPAGGVVAVIGPNGSGKTTLLHMVLGLIPAASGQLEVFGQHPGQDNDSIGYVPQHYAASAGEAIRAASGNARPGEIVLLAPACSSFDQFENYEHRGRVFKELVSERRGWKTWQRE